MFYEVWFISPLKTRQCTHTQSKDPSFGKTTTFGILLNSCSIHEKQGEPPAIGGRCVARFLVEKGTVFLRSMGFHCVCRFGKLALATLGPESLVTYKGHAPSWPLSLLFRLLTGLAIFSDNKREAQSVCTSPTAADDDDPSLADRALGFIGPPHSIAKRPWVGTAADECLPLLGRYLLPCTRHYILYYIL